MTDRRCIECGAIDCLGECLKRTQIPFDNEIKTGPLSGQVPVFMDNEFAEFSARIMDMPRDSEVASQTVVTAIISNGVKFAGVYLNLNDAEELFSNLLDEIRVKIKEQQ